MILHDPMCRSLLGAPILTLDPPVNISQSRGNPVDRKLIHRPELFPSHCVELLPHAVGLGQ